MNFYALIGIAEKVDKQFSPEFAKIMCKVEKPNTTDQDENWYELIPVLIDKKQFASELKQLSKDAIVGIKGRLVVSKDDSSSLAVITERFQLF